MTSVLSSGLLSPPRKTAGEYILTLTNPSVSPPVHFNTAWELSPEWSEWAAKTRRTLLNEIVATPRWFSHAPKLELLEMLFSPWAGKTMRGTDEFFCDVPSLPDVSGLEPGLEPGPVSGFAKWSLISIVLTATSITPRWSVAAPDVTWDVVTIPELDCISVFDESDQDISGAHEEREIRFDEIEEAPPGLEPPTRLRTREWDIHKSAAKERVREARLKAQIADRIAEKEELRFVRKYGDIEDGESRFSEYDSTDDDDTRGETDTEGGV